MRHFIVLTVLGAMMIALGGCATAPRDGGDILVMGDSVMAWNGSSGNAIPDAMSRSLGREVVSVAVPGAQFANDSRLQSAIGLDIRRQFPGGSWNWVVLNGGANDLGFDDCGCGACGAVVDRLIAPDAQTGAILAFLSMMRINAGAQVLWMGYYAGNGKGSFEGCRDDLVMLEERIARHAAGRDGVFFVDSEAVIDPRDPTHFAKDNTHPSPQGSALIGALLARTIKARSQSAP